MTDTNPNYLGEFLLQRQKQLKLNQSAFAKRLGLSPAYLNQLMAGKKVELTARMAKKLARGTGVTVDRIIQLIERQAA